MISRRKFLVGLTSCTALGAITGLPLTQFLSERSQWLVSAASDKKGNFFVAAFDLSGQLINKVDLPARGHDVSAIKSKPGHALVFARRPGEYVLEVDFTRGVIVREINVANDSRFYGHGLLVDNDNVLVSAENDYRAGKGAIVLRDTRTQQVLAKYDSGGIGPHQIALMPSSKSKQSHQIVIANGGIRTHPEQGRKKLNLATMKPNLAYMDLKSGKVIDKFELKNHQLSIRHLDVSDEGKVIAGMQYQGAYTDEVPLAIAHHGEESLQFLKADTNTWRSMKQYTASVCINSNQNLVAITCPKANLLTYWQLDTNEFIASHKLKDGAGAALAAGKIYASTGRGRIISQQEPLHAYQISADFKDVRWDNHMTAIEVPSLLS